MIGPIEKGIEMAKVSTPPVGVYEGVDLRSLPQYISFKAAKKSREKVLLTLAAFLGLVFFFEKLTNGMKVTELEGLLRKKEYIVVPDFITVSPHSVNDEYVHRAIFDFLDNIGNVDYEDIKTKYKEAAEMMGEELQKRFKVETAPWIDAVIEQRITETLHCPKKEVIGNDKGLYQVNAFCLKKRFSYNEYLKKSEEVGKIEEAIELEMRLIAPKSKDGKKQRWLLEVTDLQRTTKKAFSAKKL